MKATLATSLLILLTLITIKEAVYVALFQANQDYIAENLCENKDITQEISERVCKGKCYVQKVIVENNQNNSENELIPTLEWEKTNLIIANNIINSPKNLIFKVPPHGQLLTDNQGVRIIITSPPEVV
jgi:hypothetical protein